MPVHFPKIIDVDLSKSKYDANGGNFYFKLDGPVEERWKQSFRDAASQEHADSFIARQPVVHNDEWIVAFAAIEGENDLNTVTRHLKHAIEVANEELGQVVKAESAEKAKQDAERSQLEQKVKQIIGKLDFS
ncbi:hypothetical protein IB221_04725 [Pantoea sp. PNT01]|uniref:hypothetical protein n=1 Tax=Pantoea sp. PNT01 TaxID=2769271 RepID=UPI001783C84F|nr:hypothetical protein [Pantoea sp. PNT01]MBD9551569.1 hypothetical protein [Pantoea sp. PNT01]